MVTTGAEMPILNGIGSAACAGAAAPSANARPSEAAVMRSVPDRIESSLELPSLSIERTHQALETAIAAVNVAAVAVSLHVLFDQTPDAVFDCMETRLAFYRQLARALDVHRDCLLDLPRPAGRDRDAVRYLDRLVDLMGLEQHGVFRLHPDLQQLLLHQLASLRVE